MLNKVRRELEKVQKYILENEEAFGRHNLKLYDLFNQVSNQEMDKFYNFCEFYSEDFNNLLAEEGCEVYQVGRTSNFYLHDESIIDLFGEEVNIDNSITNALYHFGGCEDIEINGGEIDFDFIKRNIEEGYSTKEDIVEQLEYIIKDFYCDFYYWAKDIVFIYDAITDFKHYSLELFNDFE